MALLRTIKSLDKIKGDNADENVGVQIIRRALEAPLRTIANNAGAEGAIVVQKVLEGKDSFGYNARTEVYEDLIKAGVIDPTKVTRTALQNAASVSGLMLTTEAVISEKPSKGDDDDSGGGGMPGGMGGGMPGMGGMGGMM